MSRWVSSRAEQYDRYNPYHGSDGKFSSGGDSDLTGIGNQLEPEESDALAPEHSDQLSGVNEEEGSGERPMEKGSSGGKKAAKAAAGTAVVGAVGKKLSEQLKQSTGGLGFAQFAIGKSILSPADGEHLKITHQISANATHATVAGQLLASGKRVTRTFAKYGQVDPNATVQTF